MDITTVVFGISRVSGDKPVEIKGQFLLLYLSSISIFEASTVHFGVFFLVCFFFLQLH